MNDLSDVVTIYIGPYTNGRYFTKIPLKPVPKIAKLTISSVLVNVG